jgi:hypothetical protein
MNYGIVVALILMTAYIGYPSSGLPQKLQAFVEGLREK